MPLYEYVCLACERPFEARRDVDATDPPCPACGAERVRRRYTVFATAQPSAAGSAPASGGGGCACGGACACGR